MTPRKATPALVVAALGVVFGDLGTSPLYTLQECIVGKHPIEPSRENLLGILSQIIWSLIIVVTVKYIGFLMRADNRGEGGILALLALLPKKLRSPSPGKLGLYTVLALAGASLLFGDGIITPAISVLSAVEGLGTVTHEFDRYIVALAAVILFCLFAIQRFGTGGIGRLFGPVMLVWFVVAGALGVRAIALHPDVLYALSPAHAVSFFVRHGFGAFRLLGGVVLAVTGGEALYADMGHFGRAPIRDAWHFVCLPSLVLCYLGQGATLLDRPGLAVAPFYAMCPEGAWRYPFVALAAGATVIASQALISGVFSLTHQAIQLGFFPRIIVRHTSQQIAGQTYLPFMNWLLAIGCIALVVTFQASAKLAAAYGLAVSGTMGITSIIFYRVTVERWAWRRWKAVGILALFLSFDVSFTGANLLKLFDGGFIPLAIGGAFLLVMVIWSIGKSLLHAHLSIGAEPLGNFLAKLGERTSGRAPGMAVYLAAQTDTAPLALVSTLERFRVVHETAILLTVVIEDEARVPNEERITTESLGTGFYRVVLRYGFFESPNVPLGLDGALKALALPAETNRVYILARQSFVASSAGQMGAYSEAFFAFLARNARPASDQFQLPPENVLEIGSRIDL